MLLFPVPVDSCLYVFFQMQGRRYFSLDRLCDVIPVRLLLDSRVLWSLNDVAACLPVVSAVAVAVRVTDTGLSVLTGTLVAIMTVGSSEIYIIMYRQSVFCCDTL